MCVGVGSGDDVLRLGAGGDILNNPICPGCFSAGTSITRTKYPDISSLGLGVCV